MEKGEENEEEEEEAENEDRDAVSYLLWNFIWRYLNECVGKYKEKR